ncbi:probable phospholipid-transporting ATPase VD [Thalassophryne amazonica]|uniref:probable phospholipid-transporting ATPase VD n=1 Tax=Thalassophryne amazonica TaxID=390379 RepID=UPI00147190D9|nr:probable phospholipid-transporting ATPase VD [Thalassophryne amazonica]
MERLHWVRHRCRQLWTADTGRGLYSPPDSKHSLDPQLSGHSVSKKRRTVFPQYGPHQQDHQTMSKAYKGNAIRTTKYSLLTFIPLNLFQQFHRAANLYFLFLVLLNWIPVVEAFQKEITMIPLLVVLTVIAVKDALEDYRRHLYDKKINNNTVEVYSGQQKAYTERCWKDVQVGDFIRLSCNDIIPADMLLLWSSDSHGVCFIETANLDGETNLKQRHVVPDLPLQGDFSPETFHCRIECENPNNNLNSFRGYIENTRGTRVGLHHNNLLLRGCTIRNTETVVGIVVYAGHETKAMMNNSGPRYKRSMLEQRLNTDVLWCVILLVIMCLTASTGHGLWLKQLKDPVFMADGETSPALAGFYVFWTMIIVLQVLIPISLYVSIEIVKLGQIYFIQHDLDLYDEQLDSSIECRALNITEDLGQIQYAFCDKTGTLTENKMVFCRCSIYGIEYSHEENARRLEVYEAEARSVTLRSGCSSKSLSCRSLSCNRSSESLHTLAAESEPDQEPLSTHIQPRTSAFCSRTAKDVVPDPELVRKLSLLSSPVVPAPDGSTGPPSCLELTFITDFFLALAICNTVVVSSPSQPRHAVPEARPPLMSLEDIKLMFQRFSYAPFSALSNLSPLQTTGSPHSLASRLFTRGKTSTFTVSPDPNTTSTTEVSNPSLETSSLKQNNPDRGEGRNATTQQMQDTKKNLQNEMSLLSGACQVKEDLTNELDTDSCDDELLYEAESPDEAALVHAARAYHCTLRGRSAECVVVDLPGVGSLVVQLLHVLPFDSNRKRMSVVIRHPLTGQVVVYTKGADSVIMDLAETPQGAEQTQESYGSIRNRTQSHLDNYARQGLRTLCIAKKIVEEDKYEVWLKRHRLAENSIENREELLLESAQSMETNLTLLGTTGILDRLQEEVPETTEALQKAGIKIWILTGDKQETAINIAHACKLLRTSDQLLTANCGSKESCAALLQELKYEVEHAEEGVAEVILVIDGRTLDWAVQEDLQGDFVELSRRCKAVICCRCTPLQKSQVVQLIRDQLAVMTLAVGDGANDVSMIQVADVGIGISGQEGLQAVMSSDFAISRFKHLRKLLLVHGHWCYFRLASMILYFFYKNIMYVNLLFWYQFFSGFSGSIMTNSWLLILFNLLFTSVPPLVYGMLDQDVAANTLMELPEFYQAGQTLKVYVPVMFWLTVLDAFYQSLICFFVPYFAYAGSDVDQLSFGSPINASALFIILLHQVIESHTLTWLHALALVVSGCSYFVFVLIFSKCCVTCSPPTNPVGVEMMQMSHLLFYLVCTLTTVTALLPRLLFRALCNTLNPRASLTAAHLDHLDSKTQCWNLNQGGAQD